MILVLGLRASKAGEGQEQAVQKAMQGRLDLWKQGTHSALIGHME